MKKLSVLTFYVSYQMNVHGKDMNALQQARAMAEMIRMHAEGCHHAVIIANLNDHYLPHPFLNTKELFELFEEEEDMDKEMEILKISMQ